MPDLIKSPAPSSSYFLPPTPPPATISSKGPRRPSISVAMSWLTHKSTSSTSSLNGPNQSRFVAPQVPIRISEPRPLEEFAQSHTLGKANGRVLGSGAEIVGTPQQALQNSRSPPRRNLPPIPASPASPPPALRPSKSSPHLQQTPTDSPLDPNLPPLPTRKPSPKATPLAIAPITPIPTPPVAPHSLIDPIPEASDVPPFSPVLVSPSSPIFPSHVKPSQFLLTLETSTSTFRTTLGTLISRPSRLTSFVESLMETPTNAASPSSANAPSPFSKAFNEHLVSEGVEFPKSTSTTLHIFLDRPSAPYFHILAYLRSPASSTQTLPRAVQISPHSSSSPSSAKLETLMELRDEAIYLGLEDLERLCNDEIRTWFTMKRTHHNRNGSNVSLPLRTQRHQALLTTQSSVGSNPRASGSSTALPWESEFGARNSVDVSDGQRSEVDLPMHSPPPILSSQTPTSVGLGLRMRSRSNSRTDPASRPSFSVTSTGSKPNLRTSHPPHSYASRSSNWI